MSVTRRFEIPVVGYYTVEIDDAAVGREHGSVVVPFVVGKPVVFQNVVFSGEGIGVVDSVLADLLFFHVLCK